ncbi:MAG: chemotaxis-specific protein-glutamate methyltransferase CheB [Oligoflexia bacterium]|nr:chemotaxis-specific protein-glutamate methyltransferase CheB [Oligoflexia bacterium]
MKDYAFRIFQDLIRMLAGVSIADNQRLMVENRVRQRLITLKIDSISRYINYVHNNASKEVPFLISALTTHTTSFFREEDHFKYLDTVFLPQLFVENPNIFSVDVWSAACSSGEEAYSLAITLLEYIQKNNILVKIKVTASDIDIKMIQRAQVGVYKIDQVKEIKEDWKKRYFLWGTGGISDYVKIKDQVKDVVSFKRKNLFAVPYFSEEQKFDIIFVRNVFIYFDKISIKKVLDQITHHLKPSGILVLGHTENLLDIESPFKLLGNSIYCFKQEFLDYELKLIKRIKFREKLKAADTVDTADSAGVEEFNVPAPAAAAAAAATASKSLPIKVLVVDDSATIRALLHHVLSEEYGFSIVAEVENPLLAEEVLKQKEVDVITLDINMEPKDGITYLKELSLRNHPPVVMISSISQEDALNSLRAFEYGAIDYIEKPDAECLPAMSDYIRDVVKEVASTGTTYAKTMIATDSIAAVGGGESIEQNEQRSGWSSDRYTSDHYVSDHTDGPLNSPLHRISSDPGSAKMFNPRAVDRYIIVIGASTGGIVAIKEILESFYPPTPAILIVQHIPPVFSTAFAERLRDTAHIKVKEARNSEELSNSTAYVAPGGRQMGLDMRGGSYYINVNDDPPINKMRPSVDYLYNSIANILSVDRNSRHIVGVLLTGMGADGAKGLLSLKNNGAITIVQDEYSSVVYGMPRAAKEIGAATVVASLGEIPGLIIRHCGG